MATDPIPDPITRMYERVHGEWTGDDGHLPASGNTMLAVAALLAEVALRYDDLDRRVRVLEDRMAAGHADSPD